MTDRSSGKRRRTPRQRRSRDTVAVILEAAARVFDREGYDATTNRIAGVAGVSVGSIYEYFADKDALLLALAHDHLDAADAAVDGVLAGEVDLDGLLRRVVDTLVDLHLRHPGMHETLQRVGARAPHLVQRAEVLQARIIAAFASLVPRAVPADQAVLRARVVVATLGALTHSLILEAGDRDTARQLRDEIYVLCSGYLEGHR